MCMCVQWQNSNNGRWTVCHWTQLLLWDWLLRPRHGHLGRRESWDIIQGKQHLCAFALFLSVCCFSHSLSHVTVNNTHFCWFCTSLYCHFNVLHTSVTAKSVVQYKIHVSSFSEIIRSWIVGQLVDLMWFHSEISNPNLENIFLNSKVWTTLWIALKSSMFSLSCMLSTGRISSKSILKFCSDPLTHAHTDTQTIVTHQVASPMIITDMF